LHEPNKSIHLPLLELFFPFSEKNLKKTFPSHKKGKRNSKIRSNEHVALHFNKQDIEYIIHIVQMYMHFRYLYVFTYYYPEPVDPFADLLLENAIFLMKLCLCSLLVYIFVHTWFFLLFLWKKHIQFRWEIERERGYMYISH